MRIVFFGTPNFSADILNYLVEGGVQVVAIVTQKDQKEIPPVKLMGQKIFPHIPIFQPEKASDPNFIQELKRVKADLFVVIAYGHILKKEVLYMPSLGSINVHFSLLPKYRGAAPMQRAILAGDKESGVTIMEMDEGIDTGAILAQAKTSLDDMTFDELRAELVELAKPLLLKVIKMLSRKEIEGGAQDNSKASHAPKINIEECKLDFSSDGEMVHNKIRAFSREPGAWCYCLIDGEKKRLKIFRSTYLPDLNGKMGEIKDFKEGDFQVACKKGGIAILELQLEGKKALKADQFIRGIKGSISLL